MSAIFVIVFNVKLRLPAQNSYRTLWLIPALSATRFRVSPDRSIACSSCFRRSTIVLYDVAIQTFCQALILRAVNHPGPANCYATATPTATLIRNPHFRGRQAGFPGKAACLQGRRSTSGPPLRPRRRRSLQ